MKLSTFIQQSLADIVRGIEAANADIAGTGSINPVGEKIEERLNHPSIVEFDISVTVSDEGAGSSSAEIKVLGLFPVGGSTSGSLETRKAETGVSRLRFEVPIQFPPGTPVGKFDSNKIRRPQRPS